MENFIFCAVYVFLFTWLLGSDSVFLEYVSEYESVSQICVWKNFHGYQIWNLGCRSLELLDIALEDICSKVKAVKFQASMKCYVTD